MIYPKFLKKEDLIGVTAPSQGIKHKEESFDKSLNNLKKEFRIIETNNVRTNGIVSSSKEIRVKELNDLIKNDNVKMILAASGGDLMMEILPLLDFDLIKENIKWYQGYSDITNLLYVVTTKLDIATIYAGNAGSFDMTNLHKSLKNNIEFMKGNLVIQENFNMYEKEKKDIDGYNLDTKVNVKCDNDVHIKGRIIGGCLDVLKNIVGTSFDYTKEFIERYKDDGIIWYFDIFSMTSEDVLRTLWQFENAGWFEYSKAFIFGRVKYPNSFLDMSYEDAYKHVLKDKIIIHEADIGHVKPTFTIINGSYVTIDYSNSTFKVETELKGE